MKILIVDDDEVVLLAVKHRLAMDKHSIITSPDGLEAYKIIAREHVDLIISDIAMPYLSGFELLNYLKNELKKNIPIILISALDQKEIILAAYKSGADDFITKPIDLEELAAKVSAHLSLLIGKREVASNPNPIIQSVPKFTFPPERTN